MGTPDTPQPATLDRPIFVLQSGDTGVHVYRDAQSVMDAKELDVNRIDSFEFFDVQGQRLAPVISGTGVLTGLRVDGGPPDVGALQARLCAVRQYLVDTVDTRLADTGSTIGREAALRVLPELEGRSLADCYVLLEPVFGHAYGDGQQSHAADDGAPTRHDGGWWHNLWAH